jgi:glycosyltransferase involved in cell wall biosynthesis
MTMVEAQACGTPVIALEKGGALDAVDPATTGTLYEEPGDLTRVLSGFDPGAFDRRKVREWASENFNPSLFDRAVAKIVADAVAAR